VRRTTGRSSSNAASSSAAVASPLGSVLVAGLVTGAVLGTCEGGRARAVLCRAAMAGKRRKKAPSDFEVGESVSGRIVKMNEGRGASAILVDIGATQRALLQMSPRDFRRLHYREGTELEGLRVTELGRAAKEGMKKRQMCVSLDKLAIDYKRGDVISGKVASTSREFLRIEVPSLSRHALALPRYLEKYWQEYEVGEEFVAKVQKVAPSSNTLFLTQLDLKPRPERMEAKYDIADISEKRNKEMEGVVMAVAKFGIFVDIGAGKDALVPRVHLPDGKLPKDFTPGQKVQCWVMEASEAEMKITLSLVAPPEGGF